MSTVLLNEYMDMDMDQKGSSNEEAGTRSCGSWHDQNLTCQENGHLHDSVDNNNNNNNNGIYYI